MNENGKKRASSFRKLFPQIFFTNKTKEKSASKESKKLKIKSDSYLISNQYHDPQIVIAKSSNVNDGDNENIYENLTAPQRKLTETEIVNHEIPSNHSSSSTLVSESVKKKSFDNSDDIEINYRENVDYTARPQVPRRPQNEILVSMPQTSTKEVDNPRYPDVYYHSLEKLTDKITPLDEIHIYRASKVQANPAPVGAEIKKVSTRFLISPKKEAEVRTIQPNRARSLSLDKNSERTRGRPLTRDENSKDNRSKKPYNYSAPTSPMPVTHKIPHMPKTVSPYEHIRKTMIEAEEKRNSLSRSNNLHKSLPSQRLIDYNETQSTKINPDNIKLDDVAVEKERTRQKIEAFYWQKLKEQKQKEDEFLLRQSMNSPMRNHSLCGTNYSNSGCSTPNSFVVEPRSYSLPRGKDFRSNAINQPIYSPFIRNAPERRTDTYVRGRNSFNDQDVIVYRHPEKLLVKNSITPMIGVQDQKLLPIFQRGSLTREFTDNQQPKRVSFEEQYLSKTTAEAEEAIKKVGMNVRGTQECEKTINARDECPPNALRVGTGSKGPSNVPPRPPIRTTSVCSTIGRNQKVQDSKKQSNMPVSSQLIYSESESGSEAGEIQRILQNNSRKGKSLFFLFNHKNTSCTPYIITRHRENVGHCS